MRNRPVHNIQRKRYLAEVDSERGRKRFAEVLGAAEGEQDDGGADALDGDFGVGDEVGGVGDEGAVSWCAFVAGGRRLAGFNGCWKNEKNGKK